MAEEVTFTVDWTEPALCDLERIDRYLRRRNPRTADRIGEALLRKAGLLPSIPNLDQFGRKT